MPDYTPEEWLTRLNRAHEAELPYLREYNDLYELKQKLSYMHPDLIRELDGRIQQLILNWPRLVIEALEDRLDVTGFRFADDESAADDLWDIWTANGMDTASQQGRIDALVMRRSFLAVGTREKDPALPLITVESPLQMVADWDPATRQVRAARKKFHEFDPATGVLRETYETLYLPNSTHWYENGGSGRREVNRDEHNLGEVPIVPLVNRPRTLVPGGVSELVDIKPISDAACKIATDMMIGAEFHAMPRRWALGFEEEDFQDEHGNKVSKWSRIAGRLWSSSRTRQEGAEVGQFPESSLANFHETIELLARQVAAVGALPPNYLGLVADDAASADAIRSRETRLIKRAERRQGPCSASYLQMNRLALRIRDGVWNPRARSLQTLWRDPATPTRAQAADATVKLVTAKIIPIEQAREDLGYTAVQRERMRRMDQDARDSYLYGDYAGMEGPKTPPLADVTGAVDG